MTLMQEMFQSLGRVQWQDYLDIVLVTFLIYKLLPIFKSTGNMRVAGVIGVILLASLITDVMQLQTLNYLLSQLTAIGLIAVVILFQPELRRTLDQLGNVKLKKLFGAERRARKWIP